MSPQPPKGQKPDKNRWQQQPAPKPQPKPQPAKQKAPARPAAPLQLAAPKGSKEINFACPACGRPFAMPARAVGRKAKCSCGARMVIPVPGGVPRALWMPSPEAIKAQAQQWKTLEPGEAGKSATEISLETSPAKVAMYIGVVVAAGIGYFVWKNNQESAVTPTNGGGQTTAGTTDIPKDLAAGELAGICQQNVFTVEAVDGKGALLKSAPGFLMTKGIVATALSNVLGADAVHVKAMDGNSWQVQNILGMDDASDLVLLEIAGLERQCIPPDEAAITDPGTQAWAGWPVKNPTATSFTKPAGPAFLRLSRAFPPGAPIMDAKGKLLAMSVASATGDADAIAAKSLAALAAKKSGVAVAEALSIAAGGPHKVGPQLIGRLLAAGRSDTAIRMLENEIAKGGSSADASMWLGQALMSERRPRSAALRFGDSARTKESWAARTGEGLARLESGETTRALAAFRASVKAGGGTDALTLAGLALALARSGDAAKAISAANSALAGTDDLEHRAWFLAAVAGATARDSSLEKKALEALEKAKVPDSELLLARGECALARGDAASAEKSFAAAGDAGAGSRAFAARGRALEALGQKDAARDAFVAAANENGMDEEAVLGAARTLEASGNRDKAISVLAPLLAAETAHAAANAAMGRILIASDAAKAVTSLEQAVKSDPDNAEFARLFAQAQAASGDRAAAEQALSTYLAHHSDDDVRIDLALIQAASNPQQALATLGAVRATSGPVAARASHARGTALVASNKGTEARAAWEIAVSLDPANGLYRFQRALAAEAGDLHESRAVWEAYVAWGKKNGDDPARVSAAEKRLLERFGR